MKQAKHSIRTEMALVFLGLLVVLLGLVFFINNTFLGRYYFMHKVADVKDMYEMMDATIVQGEVSESGEENLIRQGEQLNIAFSVVNSRGEVVTYTEQEREGMLFSQLLGYLLEENRGDVVEEDEDYTIYRTENPIDNGEDLELFGTLSDGSMLIMQTPLESIRTSASLANTFLIYIGIFVLILGTLCVWFFSRRITKPIMELASLSERMANLDFDVHYTSGGNDEIGVLGENFNTMSRKLEENISELKSANNRLQADIEQKEKQENMQTEFLGNVSHELKTPIALIQGYAEGLKEGVNDDPESRDFYCDVIMDEANRMNELVQSLLTLNELEYGEEQLDVQRFDVVRLIQGVIDSCDILIQQAQADVDFISDKEVFVWADEFKTEQVIRNYLTNAIYHVANEKRIEIRVIPQEDTVRVTVFNSGDPIPEEDIDKLWDKFYKVDKSHTQSYGGSGVGLSIVKAIMESFHQDYGVCNFDNGVEFWFELDTSNGQQTKEKGEEET